MGRAFCSDVPGVGLGSGTLLVLQGWDLGALGMPRGSIFFSNIVMQHMVKGQIGGIVVRSKGQISLNFR